MASILPFAPRPRPQADNDPTEITLGPAWDLPPNVRDEVRDEVRRRLQLPIPMPPPADRLREAFRLFVERCDNDGWEIADRDHGDPTILTVELHHPAAADLCVAVCVVIDQPGPDCRP